MRIIGYIDHKEMKITVFKMNNRISLKFEKDLFEQTYKFRESLSFNSLEDVKNAVTQRFTNSVIHHFELMKSNKERFLKITPQRIEDEFDEII